MNNNGQQNQAISDDQELASVLKGMQQQNHTLATSDPEARANDDAASLEGPSVLAAPAVGATVATPTPGVVMPSTPATPPSAAAPSANHSAQAASTHSSPELDTIKKAALEELRPLVGKLNLPPKEKFDTLLLIIRSTDDKSLLEPAHAAAKSITDEVERAQALLDVIKEIDYFSSQQ